MDRKTKADILLIGGIVIIALVVWLLLNSKNQTGKKVVVRVNGSEVCRYSLDEEGTYFLNGGSNILTIQDGKAFISEADCPDRICIKEGKIFLSGQCITCLPNRLTVTVEGGRDDVDIAG